MFGSDSTGGGIGWQFRQIKNDAKGQRACVASGGDPLDLGIGSKGGESVGSSRTSTYLIFLSSSTTQHRAIVYLALLTGI
jgi:hypothetical protein